MISENPIPPGPAPVGPPRASTPPPPSARASAGHERLIFRVRSRQERQLWLQGALYGAAAAVLLLTAAGFAAQLSVSAGRALLIACPLAFAALLVFFGVYLAIVRVGDDARTARLVARHLPEVSYDVLAAVELRRELEAQPSFSRELAEAFLHRLDERTDWLDARRVVDGRHAKRAGLALAAVALGCAVLAFAWRTQWVAGARAVVASAEPQRPQAQREPITGDVELTYRYPAYTGLSARVVPGTNGEVSAPAGTEVELKTRADRDLLRADLVLNGTRVPLRVGGTRALVGSFVVQQPGSYHFAFYGRGDSPIAVGPEVSVNVEADAAPQVRLLAPADGLEIDPGQNVTLRYEASDDYGLSALELVFRVPGNPEEQRLPFKHDEGRRARGQQAWDLSTVKLEPGQELSYYLEVRDNDEVAGKKKGVSRTQVLKLYSAAEHRRAAVKRAEELWDRLVIHLADRLEGPDRDTVKDPGQITRAQPTDSSGTQLVDELQFAALEIGKERDAPGELVVALVNIAQGLRPRLLGTSLARRVFLRVAAASGPLYEPGRRLTSAVSEEIAETEKDVLYLESLLDRQKLLELKELGEQLQRERRELASLIEQYKQSQDPLLHEAILRDVAQMKTRIAELMQRMAELAKGIRDEHLNQEALAELMQDQDMAGALDEIERLMREGKADEALAKLQELAMQMDQMLENLEDAEDQSGEDYPELAEKFQDFMEQLGKTRAEQEKVAGETRQLRDQQRERVKDRLNQRGQALKEELIKKSEEVLKDYQAIGADRISASVDKPLEQAQASLDTVKNALQVDDFDLAAEAAARAEAAANELRGIGEQQRQLDQLFQNPSDAKRASRELADRLARDASKVEEISRKLQQLFPQAGTALSETDKEKLKSLSQEQRQLEQSAQQLQQKMDEMAQLAPVFGEEAQQQLDAVGKKMGSAAQKMEGRDPGRGYGEQKAALEQLSELEKQMQNSGQGKGKKGKGLPLPMFGGRREGGRGTSREKIEIPDADQFQAPKEFRKDLLDAMKQGAPDRYKDQVKRYYEELVK